MLEKLTEVIYRIKIPFENIYTSVFALELEDGIILADCATTSSDVENYIIPALEKLKKEVKYISVSHSHGDHNGGLSRLKEEYPQAKVISFSQGLKDGKTIENYTFYNLKGHSEDSMGIMENKEKTLLTFDSIQLCGVGRYGSGIEDVKAYLETVERIREFRPKTIITSHDFVPLGYLAKGEKEINEYLDFCIEYTKTTMQFALGNKHLSPKEIAEKYNEENKHLPPLSGNKMEALLIAAQKE